VLSVLLIILGSVYPLGAVLQGAIADQIGLRTTTFAAAALMLALLLLARLFRPGFASALDSPAAPLDGLASGTVDSP
jgi:predicted MFS family arabinose efflux permease